MVKQCGKCKETKPVREFHKKKSAKDGLQNHCKMCIREYHQSEKHKQSKREYRQSERHKQSQRKYRQSEKYKQYRREYEQSERHKQSQRKYKQSEKRKQSKREYRQSENGKQASRRHSHNRRTRKTKAGGSYTDAEWRRLCKFYDFHCLKCDVKFPFKDLTMDHIKAVSKLGPSFIWNAQPLCGPCNSSKNNREIDYRQTLPDWIDRDGPIWIQGSLF